MQKAELLTRGLAAHLRDPAAHPAPAGWEERRTAIYRRLFINNVLNLLSGNFPVACKVLGEKEFTTFVRHFYAEHASHTPLFPEIAREMLRFVEENPQYWAERWPFLYELMHYEWVELALAISAEEIDAVPADRDGDLASGIPQVSPLLWRLAYHYPVERIGADYQPMQPPAEPTFLAVWRDRADQVRFLRTNPIAAQLLNQLAEDPQHSGLEQLRQLATAISSQQPDAVIQAGLGMLTDWRDRDILLGTQTPAPTEAHSLA
jgi:hypothetical protein